MYDARRRTADDSSRREAQAARHPGPWRCWCRATTGPFSSSPRTCAGCLRARSSTTPCAAAGVPAFARHPEAPQLTARQLEVLRLLAEYLRPKDMAARLHIRKLTVRTHVERMQVALVHDQATSYGMDRCS